MAASRVRIKLSSDPDAQAGIYDNPNIIIQTWPHSASIVTHLLAYIVLSTASPMGSNANSKADSTANFYIGVPKDTKKT